MAFKTASLLIISFILFAVPFVTWGIKNYRQKKNLESIKHEEVKTALLFSAFFVLAICFFRYPVSAFENPELTALERAVNSLVMSFRTFSFDDAYVNLVGNVKLVCQEYAFGNDVQNVLIAYASVLCLLAPVAGGAVVVEVLADIFPKIRLFLHRYTRRDKCYFSHLNAQSLALAKSLNRYYVKTCGKRKPVIIFCDAYLDSNEEKSNELLSEAKQLGAICVKDDLAYIPKSRPEGSSYYLINDDEQVNINTLLAITDDKKVKYTKGSRVYLFIQSDCYAQFEKKIDESIKIIPVDAYRNLINNLFVDVPLYEPLIRKKDSSELNVTVLGNGIIGTEAFLNAYWFGQMMCPQKTENGENLVSCKLNINVLSRDTAETFWSKINYINPEIKETVELKGEPATDKKILCYNDKGQKNPPYCEVKYIQSDVKEGDFWVQNSDTMSTLLESDYIIVALGSDAENISIAEKIHMHIAKEHLEKGNSDTVIAYAVFDPKLCEMLNSQNNDKYGIYMYAFGNLEQVYSTDNVFMSKTQALAEELGNAYYRVNILESHVEAHSKRKKEKDNYDYWADIARASHIGYKVFSLGWIKSSLFDDMSDSGESHKKYVAGICSQYKRIASLGNDTPLSEEDEAKRNDVESKKESLAWLEHRRWCAFTRTMGLRYTDAMEKNIAIEKSHKNMPLKLHPCLVEAGLTSEGYYMLEEFSESGDYLDKASYMRRKIRGSGEDFKKYDYYKHDVDENILYSEFVAWNHTKDNETLHIPELADSSLLDLCKNGQEKGVLPYETKNGLDWIIPVAYLESIIKKYYSKEEDKTDLCFRGAYYKKKEGVRENV